MARKVSEESKALIWKYRDEGLAVSKVAEMVGCSYDTAYRYYYDPDYMDWREWFMDEWKMILKRFGKEEVADEKGKHIVRKIQEG